MTLPTTSILTSEAFNNFVTMSYATTTTTTTTTPPTTSFNEGQHEQQQQPQQQRLPPTTTQPLYIDTTSFSSSLELAVESIMPNIFLTKNFIACNETNLREFTHIIIIDKHIQELYYPSSPVFKLSDATMTAENGGGGAFEFFGHHALRAPSSSSVAASSLSFGKEFEAIDLNFGEKSYLTTVLPNCYRAVKFINKALRSVSSNILVIDCNGGEQKCVTIVVAYLMYKHNISFSNAFSRLKEFYKKADLDRFYMSQLYEYEPILQVQRAQSRGHSCSRELHSAILKRKKRQDDDVNDSGGCSGHGDGTNEFFDTLNPLSQFNPPPTTPPATMQQQQQREQNHQTDKQPPTPSAAYNGGFTGWDDYYAME